MIIDILPERIREFVTGMMTSMKDGIARIERLHHGSFNITLESGKIIALRKKSQNGAVSSKFMIDFVILYSGRGQWGFKWPENLKKEFSVFPSKAYSLPTPEAACKLFLENDSHLCRVVKLEPAGKKNVFDPTVIMNAKTAPAEPEETMKPEPESEMMGSTTPVETVPTETKTVPVENKVIPFKTKDEMISLEVDLMVGPVKLGSLSIPAMPIQGTIKISAIDAQKILAQQQG